MVVVRKLGRRTASITWTTPVCTHAQNSIRCVLNAACQIKASVYTGTFIKHPRLEIGGTVAWQLLLLTIADKDIRSYDRRHAARNIFDGHCLTVNGDSDNFVIEHGNFESIGQVGRAHVAAHDVIGQDILQMELPRIRQELLFLL